MSHDAIATYRERFDDLICVADRLRDFISTRVTMVQHIDRVTARAKTPDSFAAKAGVMSKDGTPKYAVPLVQIQDQIGARLIVFYRGDVVPVAAELERYFRTVEKRDLIPESSWSFGYFGRHWVFALPDDVIPSGVNRERIPRFFELQVKTLFQHAWSEANHDLGYKPQGGLTEDQQRRCAYTAAQAWGADRVFEELRTELAAEGGTDTQNLNTT